MTEFQLSKTAVFWDYENVPFTSGDLTNFLNDIEEIKKTLESGSLFRCFGVWKNVPETTQTEIIAAGFELIQVPQTRKNAVDQAIMISAIDYYHQSNFKNFFLISADGDFTALLMDLKQKGVKISIIARQKNISKDLKPYCSELMYLTSKGNLFKYVKKTREEILETIENCMNDAQKAFNQLIKKQSDENIQIFSLEEWKTSYLSLDDYDISPIIIGQLISFEDLFQIFVKIFGYGHTSDFRFFCIHPSDTRKSLKNIEFNIQIPNVKLIRIPIRTIPRTSFKDLIGEFTSTEPLESKVIDTEGVTEKTDKKPVEAIDSTIPPIEVKNYLSTIAKVFRERTKDNKNPGEIILTNLNTWVCISLGINSSKKIYKLLGFKTFTKAVEAAKDQFSRRIEIKKGVLFYQ